MISQEISKSLKRSTCLGVKHTDIRGPPKGKEKLELGEEGGGGKREGGRKSVLLNLNYASEHRPKGRQL